MGIRSGDADGNYGAAAMILLQERTDYFQEERFESGGLVAQRRLGENLAVQVDLFGQKVISAL